MHGVFTSLMLVLHRVKYETCYIESIKAAAVYMCQPQQLPDSQIYTATMRSV